MKRQLVSLVFVISTASLVFAADCSPQVLAEVGNQEDLPVSDLWSLRQAACGDSKCGPGDSCTIYGPDRSSSTVKARLFITGPKKFCWNATEEIINQCFLSGHRAGGSWSYGGDYYSLGFLPSESQTALPQCAYKNKQTMAGNKFYDNFDFWTSGDPTHGHVKFVDRGTAERTGLIAVRNGSVYMGVDYKNNAPNGRPAIRLQSKKAWTKGLFILDLKHMPASICGLWPAFWTVGQNWPHGGEIDIIEGVNKQDRNQMTLHTGPNCRMGAGRSQTGQNYQSNCDVAQTGNAGCGVGAGKPNSYGSNFNRNGGGAYAMERSEDRIKIWFWPRGQYPKDLLGPNPNPCNWGTPEADFPLGGSCSANHFGPQNIIFDITFCGDWAGNAYGTCGGGMNDCKGFVGYNPAAFKEAYWDINTLNVLTR